MAVSSTESPNRLEYQKSEAIDRSITIQFTFDGREYSAHSGDTIASALAAAGVKVFSRSFKYHRPRGLLCCAGHCSNCLVQVGTEPNVRACQRVVEPGIQVRHQNASPSLRFDVISLSRFVERLLPVGFYYKTFIRPRKLWPLYEGVLRRVAGLGEVRRDTPESEYAKQFLHADVAVVGGGPAGISAALAAAERGARVILFDENQTLGGHLRFTTAHGDSTVAELVTRLSQRTNVMVLTDTTVVGWYIGSWLGAMRGSRLFKIRAGAVVAAAGAYERPLVFDNNDLPGVMLGSAVQRLINLYRVAPGRRAMIVTANDDGWGVAASLRAAGITVAAIVDERAGMSSARTQALSDVPTFWKHTIQSANGGHAVASATIVPVGESNAAQTIACDLIAVSVGWTPATELANQAGGKFGYDEKRAELLAPSLPPGMYLAGRAAGTHDVETQRMEGKLAGLSAAAFVGKGSAPTNEEQSALIQRKSAESIRSSARVIVPGKKKQILCYCEDASAHDVEVSIQEGYDSIELIKRYSTVAMGPCQGKMCSMNAVHLCARVKRSTVQEIGTTTVRQPIKPVSLGVLAGQHLEPVQVTSVHAWHQSHDAMMMNAGLWMRPLHYGDPIAEVKAVRERVGLIDVSTLGKLRLTGAGVPTLLERIYVNTWRDLAVGRVRYGVMCNDEGVVLDDGVCGRVADQEWYMTTTSSGASAIYEWIQWWMQSGWGEGAHLTDVSEVYSAFNLAGPQSRAALQKLTDLDLSNQVFPYMHVRSANIADVSCRLWRIGFTGELSYEIHCPSAYSLHLWEALMAAGAEFGMMPFGVEAQRVLRLEKAHIIVGQDTDALSDPIAVGMDWAVKLEKTDFLGKRSLMRISSDGVRQRLVGFTMVDPSIVPQEGVQVVLPRADGKLEIIGRVTSSRFSPVLNQTIGLCWLPTEVAAQENATFTVCLRAPSIRKGEKTMLAHARVHQGAFYDPKGERLRT